MISFAGWNLYGTFCALLRNQGLAVVLNVFVGIAVNAAYSIAQQVNGTLVTFSTNMLKSLNPQIVKSEGAGDRKRMIRLSMLACKMSFILLSLFGVPIILEMPYVLGIWLKAVPTGAAGFCQLYICLSLVQMISYPLGVSIAAVGKIKHFQIAVGSLLIFNVPLAYVLMRLGLPPYSVLVGAILLEAIADVARVWLAHKITGLSIKEYFTSVVLGTVFSVVGAAAISYLPHLL
jgi:O-antigen/teichoic acid export membrane protein